MFHLKKNHLKYDDTTDINDILYKSKIVPRNEPSEKVKEYFKSVWTAVYPFWVHLIWTPKKAWEKFFLKVNADISRKHFPCLKELQTMN